jgi:predicted amidohydrolase YtcJ
MRSTQQLCLAVLTGLLIAGVAAAEPADIVFTNGKVYTVNEKQPWAEAVAVKGNKIVYVGDAAGAKAFTGDDTEVIDVTGKMVMPGFISAHDHLVASGWMNLGAQLYEGKSLDDYLKTIKEYADAHPDEEVIRGIGWNIENTGGKHPTAAMLDKAVPDRRAVMIDYTGHDAWLNTKALEAANVTKDTPDPVPGVSYWVRDDKGNPLGGVTEVAWMPAYVAMGAWEPETMIPEVQKKHYATIVSYGMTAFLNPGIITPRVTDPVGSVEDHEAAMAHLSDLEEKGELTVRTFTQPVFKTPSVKTDDFIGRAAKHAKMYDSDILRSFGIKIHPEGTFNAKTSYMLEPYEGTDTRGAANVMPDRMKDLILAANEAGLDVVIHVDGSATARGTIDAIEASRKAGHTDARNVMHHMYWVHPDDQKRIEAMKIPLDISPIFLTDWSDGDKPVINLLGEERTQSQFGKFLGAVEAGASVSLAADVPSAPLSIDAPLLSVESVITRRDPLNNDSKVFPPGAKGMTLEQALAAVTINPAWQIRMEDKLGSLDVGKYADLVVLDKNLFDIDPTDISEVNVMMTMMDGRFTFDRAAETAKKKVVKVEVTNPALQEAIDIEQLNLLVTDELHGAFNNPWCNDHDDAYGPDEGALRFVPQDAKAAFSKLPDQGYTFARPARAIHWKKDGQTYWILWTLKDDAAVLWAYDPEASKAVEILQVSDK